MSVVRLNLGSQKLYVKPGDPLPNFDPPPRAIRVTPIYHDPHTDYNDQYSDDDSERYSPEEPRSRRHRRLRRAVYTDSEEESRHYPPREYSRGGRYGREDPSRRHSDPPESDSYQEGSSSSQRRPDHDSSEREHPAHRYSNYQYPTSQSAGPSNYRTNKLHKLPRSDIATQGSRPEPHDSRGQEYRGHEDPLHHLERGLTDDIKKYLKLLPPSPHFRYSRCTGRRKAVCIGINYVGQKDALKGCANDARNMRDYIMNSHGFQSKDILLLVDDSSKTSAVPTRQEMFNAMQWLVEGARPHDSLFFHYSGHGGQTEDKTGRESDGMDEVIFPVDFKSAGDIIDNDLHKALVEPLPAGCRLTAIFDSCHSGTVLDLPYLHSAHGRLRSLIHISQRMLKKGMAPEADVIAFAACKDDETAADTFTGGVHVGAMSYAWIKSLKQNPHQTYEHLLQELRAELIPKYKQKAQISGTHPLDLRREFTI